MSSKQRILTGLQPSGALHLGNYFGAMQPAIEWQDKGDAYYFVASYHAMTSLKDPVALAQYTRDVAADFIACGLDPNKVTLFNQHDVSAVHELAWILSTVCPMGLLERCHSYKDKVAKGVGAMHGLFAYPVLMAADILLYGAELVPVGKDQKQHLEVTRDLAIKMNETFGADLLKLPEPMILENTAVVPGIDGQKMSKSYQNTLPLFGEEKPLRKLFMKIVTDSCEVEDPKPTEDSTILALFKLLASEGEYDQMVDDFKSGGMGYGNFKQRLWEAYMDTFAPMRARRADLTDSDLISILAQGKAKASTVAEETTARVRKAVGLL